jgi:hypothetical protein
MTPAFSSALSRRLSHLAAIALCAIAACNDASAPSSAPVALSFAARGDASTDGSGAAPTSGGTIIVSGTDTLRLTSVRLVIDELELSRSTTTTSCTDDSSSDDSSNDASSDDCFEIESGPYFVDLPLNGSVTSALSMQIPAGSYKELQMKLRRAESGDDGAFIAAHPEMNGISVLVQGSYRGVPFTWRGDVESELELHFSPALVVDGTGNVTVNIDVGRWFRSGAGAIIDPATAGVGTANHLTIAQNIRASFGAFEDDDHDGHDDHGGDRNDD